MTLTPEQIVNYDLRQALRGYATEQVDDLLDRLADQVERADRDLDDLRERLRDTEGRLEAALETEGALKRTLLTAQDAAERALADARAEADELRQTAEREVGDQRERAQAEAAELIEEARERAEDLLSAARRDAATEVQAAREQRAAIESRIEALRQLEHRHRTTLERHLRNALAQLQAAGDDASVAGIGADEDVDVGADPGAPTLTVRVRESEIPAADEQLGSAASSGEEDAWEPTTS